MTSVAPALSVDLVRIFGPRAEGFLSRCLAALRQALPVEEVWVFGSCGRSEAKADSDLDLLVVLADGHGLARPNLACFKAVSRLWPRPPIDVLAISKGQWEFEQQHPFGLFGEVFQQGIRIYGNGRS
jgi:predicted nucleotidyltransferase